MDLKDVVGQITGRSEKPSMLEVHEERINGILEANSNQGIVIDDMNGKIDLLTGVTDAHSQQLSKLSEEKAEAAVAEEIAEEEKDEAVEAEEVAEEEKDEAMEAEEKAEDDAEDHEQG